MSFSLKGPSSATQPWSSPSLSIRILAYICFNGVGFLSVAVSAAMLVGIFLFPQEVALYVIIPYYTYTLVLRRDELKDGCQCAAFSRGFPMFRVMRSFLDLSIDEPLPNELVQEDSKTGAKFILAAFPHGASADYRILMDGILHEALPNSAGSVRTLAASVLFRIPIVRELALWTGCVDARRSVAEGILDRGHSFLVMPGGMSEQIRTARGTEILYLMQRKGFVKLAMRKGVPVVPLYAFGASDLYNTSLAAFGFRVWLVKNLGICIPLATGYLGSFMCPLPVRTTLVFGKPLHFQCNDKNLPTIEEIDAAHKLFIVALTELFDQHKQRLGYGDRSLKIC